MSDRVDLHTEVTFPNLIPHGRVEATLMDDALRLSGPDVQRTLSLSDLQAIDIDQVNLHQAILVGHGPGPG